MLVAGRPVASSFTLLGPLGILAGICARMSRRAKAPQAERAGELTADTSSVLLLGYTLPITDPGPGSVIGFDESGRGLVVTSGAQTAHDYAMAIARGLGRAVGDDPDHGVARSDTGVR